ncbi:hypothetical protein AAVH_12025 [Aphelenchoides avenae]|nr:hypothetical protein AAVH_12025 [Aphelenchus avenae]
MATAEEIRGAAYELLLSRTGGYYDIQELADDLRIHCKLSTATIRATLQLHGFIGLEHRLQEMLGSDKLSVKYSSPALGSNKRIPSQYCGIPDKERFELWRKQREAEDTVLEGNIRDSRQPTGLQQDGVLEDIHYAMLKKSEGFNSVQEIKEHLRQSGVDWEAELKRRSINDARRPISLHELFKNFMRDRVRIHFRNLVAVHYAAKPIDALTLQQWKHYRRLEEERAAIRRGKKLQPDLVSTGTFSHCIHCIAGASSQCLFSRSPEPSYA